MDRGIDPAPLIAKAGIAADFLSNRDLRLEVRQQNAFLEAAEAIAGDPLLAFHTAAHCDVRNAGIFYYAAAADETLGAGLDLTSRYFSVENDSLRRSLARSGDIAVLTLSDFGTTLAESRPLKEMIFTVGLRILREISEKQVQPIRVGFAHQAAGSVAELQSWFGCPVAFGLDTTELVFPAEVLEYPVKSRDPYLHHIMVQLLEKLRLERPEPVSPLSVEVERMLVERLPRGVPSAGDIAKSIGMSRRTLERKLAQENTNISKIVACLRMRLAMHHLDEGTHSVSEIAWLLGYSDVSSFTHAFRRATGHPPSDYRKRQK